MYLYLRLDDACIIYVSCSTYAFTLTLELSGWSMWSKWAAEILAAGHGPLARYLRLRVAHAPAMPETFSPPPRVSDADRHHGTCMTNV